MARPRLRSIYQTGNGPYRIDTCEPQVHAVQEGKIRLHALTKGHYPGARLSSKTLPGLNSIGFWDGTGAQDWGLDEHRNEGVEIALLETGKMGFTVDRRHFDLVPGSLTITRPWQLREAPDLSVTDVAFANGFNSSQYFATSFRRRFKMSPSEFVVAQRNASSGRRE